MRKQQAHIKLIIILDVAHEILTKLKMTRLLLLVMLTTCAASPQDMSGKMFTFPQQTSTAHVRLTASTQDFGAVTVCHRSTTDLRRDHGLFSLSTSFSDNDFLIFWHNTNNAMKVFARNVDISFRGLDYKPNMWHSICTTWDSTSGLVQLWFNLQPTVRLFTRSGTNITGPATIILGQEQDSRGGGFDSSQSFVGMMTDVHMWDHTLSPCEIQSYVEDLDFTPGNVINWRALEFQTNGKVLIENKHMTCQ